METEIKMQIRADVQSARRTLMQFGSYTVCVAAFLGGVSFFARKRNGNEQKPRLLQCKRTVRYAKIEIEAAMPRWKAHVCLDT